MTTTHILIFALAMLGVMVMMRATRRRWQQSQASSRESVRERYAALQQSTSAARDADQVIVELDRVARQIHGRLDTQFAKLEAVIRDADERIEKLSRMIRAAEGKPALDVMVEDQPARSEAGAAASAAAEVDRPAAASGSGGASGNGAGDSIRSRIRTLARQGWPAERIASELTQPIGEVELILSLEKTVRSAGAPNGAAADRVAASSVTA